MSDLLGAVLGEDLHGNAGGDLHAGDAHAFLGLGLELAVLLEELLRAQEALLRASAALGAACMGSTDLLNIFERGLRIGERVVEFQHRIHTEDSQTTKTHDTGAARTDGPGERGLDGVDGLVQVVAVQTQASLQAQRVSGPQARGLHLGELQQRAICWQVKGKREMQGIRLLVSTNSQHASERFI